MQSLRRSTFWTTALAVLTLAWTFGSPPAAIAEDPPGRLPALQGEAALRHLQQAGLDKGLKAAFATVAQEAELNAADGADGDIFGISVAIDGNTAVVGASSDDALEIDSGSAYVFVRSGTSWSQQAKLTAADGALGDGFGGSVGISGDTVVVGADRDADLGHFSGSAYVFVRSGTSWSQQAKLTAADGAGGDQFGFSVAIDGNTAVVGAVGDDGPGIDSGSAYVFVRSGTSWSRQAKLAAADGAANDSLGVNVTIAGDSAVIGAPSKGNGAAYVFVRSGTSWSQQQKLTASDGAAGDNFGRSVSIDGDTVVAGAPLDDDFGGNSGSAYVFVRNAGSWSQQQKLTAGDGATGDQFGFSVSIEGDTAAVGSWFDDDVGGNSGSAYVFARNAGSWSQQQKLTAGDGAAGDLFGFDVAIDGNNVVAGAPSGDGAEADSGAAYVFAPENAPPDCSGASPSVARLWSPNHRLVAVSIQGVTDPDGDPVTITIDEIRQDEATDGLGDGNTCPDGTGVGTATANLRAERSALLGNGRVYTVSFTASDGQGGTCQGSVTVCVPINNNGSCVNDGATVDSTACGGKMGPVSSAFAGDRHDHQHDDKLLCFSHLLTLDCDLLCDAGALLCL